MEVKSFSNPLMSTVFSNFSQQFQDELQQQEANQISRPVESNAFSRASLVTGEVVQGGPSPAAVRVRREFKHIAERGAVNAAVTRRRAKQIAGGIEDHPNDRLHPARGSE